MVWHGHGSGAGAPAVTGRGAPSDRQHVCEPAGLAASVPGADWDELFLAVTTRLVATVTRPGVAADTGAEMKVAVLECAEALGQLHAMLGHERHRHDRLELDVGDLRSALALALGELIGGAAPASSSRAPRLERARAPDHREHPAPRQSAGA
ncbi:MAG: hypothetical protein ABI699_11415 [Caldimonas sp.]